MAVQSPAISSLFPAIEFDLEKLAMYAKQKSPATEYIVAMTPRSGSTYLCDLMRQTKLFGRPIEMLAAENIPKNMRTVPARTAEEYLANMFKHTASKNGVSGLKTSWFQFKDFNSALPNRRHFKNFKFVYLYRRDIYSQAVSLYKATESKIFHTNIQHSEESLGKLRKLEYSFELIQKWHQRIARGEEGWTNFFLANDITPLCITYEDISSNINIVMERVAVHLGIPRRMVKSIQMESAHTKIGDRQSIEWAYRYALELDEMNRASTQSLPK